MIDNNFCNVRYSYFAKQLLLAHFKDQTCYACQRRSVRRRVRPSVVCRPILSRSHISNTKQDRPVITVEDYYRSWHR